MVATSVDRQPAIAHTLRGGTKALLASYPERSSSTAMSLSGGSTPTSPDRLPLATDADIRYVVVCNEGYSSSLAAATLRRELGLHQATDLVGGFQALLAYQRETEAGPM